MAYKIEFEVKDLYSLQDFIDAVSRMPPSLLKQVKQLGFSGKCDYPECDACKEAKAEAEADAS